MPEYSHWKLELDADRIAWVTFDKAGASTNVLSGPTLRELDRLLDELQQSAPRGVVFCSGKANGFIAGADIKEFTGLENPEQAYELIRTGQRVFDRIESLPCPTVAAINGFALGGGLELALACTYRVVSEEARVSLGLPEVMLGIHPGFGGTVRSVRLIGVRAAMQLMLTGKPVDGGKALQLGLADRRVPAAELRTAAKELVQDAPPRGRAPWFDRLLNLGPMRALFAGALRKQVAGRARPEHYPAPYAMIDLWVKHGARGAAAYEDEARSIAQLICSPTGRNLVRVFLLQDRLKGLAGKSPFRFEHVHVVGAGVMGGDIAAWCALRGMSVTLQDRDEKYIEPALGRARELFDKRLRAPDKIEEAKARLTADVTGAGVARADVVIEAIFEDAAAKQALFAQVEPKLKADALLATNTSSIRLETLGEKLADRGRLVGLHFFNPVAKMQLVEVVRGEDTREEAVQKAIAFTRKLDKLPLPCRSAPGFVVNRVLMPYLNEAMFAAEEGIALADIDAAATDFGMPMGPIELADTVGLDICLHVGRILAQAFGGKVPSRLEGMVAAGHLGRKSGQGFYEWRQGKPVKPAGSPRERIPADLTDRLILAMLNEAAACLREGVVEDADLLDAGVIFGTGFAPFRGGPLAYARSRGTGEVVQRLQELERKYGERFRPDEGWRALA